MMVKKARIQFISLISLCLMLGLISIAFKAENNFPQMPIEKYIDESHLPDLHIYKMEGYFEGNTAVDKIGTLSIKDETIWKLPRIFVHDRKKGITFLLISFEKDKEYFQLTVNKWAREMAQEKFAGNPSLFAEFIINVARGQAVTDCCDVLLCVMDDYDKSRLDSKEKDKAAIDWVKAYCKIVASKCGKQEENQALMDRYFYKNGTLYKLKIEIGKEGMPQLTELEEILSFKIPLG